MTTQVDDPRRPLKLIKVGVFPPDEGSRTYRAYTRWYNPQWPGCCEHEIEAMNGTEAKKTAIEEHKDRCEEISDLPLVVRGSQDGVFKSIRELQELARRPVDSSPELVATAADAELTELQVAYNQGVEDAKCAIRAESQGGGYWAAAYINAIARRCSPFRYTGMPPEADEATREQIVQAITDIQEARESHVQWAAHLRLPHTFECQGCVDHAAHIGDAHYHDEWIEKYDNVIAVLAQVSFTAAQDDLADEVQHRMDQVVEAAVEIEREVDC